ncbi:MAG: response regulator [Chloroflexi bacterium]|nr:response regulator [Chloroflexota bacterium]
MSFYLTSSALSNLTLFILVAFVTGALWHLTRKSWRQAQRPLRTMYLAGAFTGITAFVLLAFLEDVLYPDGRFYILPLESIAIALAPVCLIQFAYHFPILFPERRREARIVFWLSMLLPLWEIYYAVFRYIQLSHGIVQYRPSIADDFIAPVYIWLFVVFLRQLKRADPRPVPLWRKLWKPQRGQAAATRTFLLIGQVPLWAMVVIILRNDFNLSNSMAAVLISLGILYGSVAFVLAYLNHIPEETSFIIKMTAVSLAIVVGMLGAAVQVVTPSYLVKEDNRQLITDHQTLRFTPNAEGGYDVQQIPYSYQTDVGERIKDKGALQSTLPTGFAFPFFNQRWSDLYIALGGRIAFGDRPKIKDTLYHYGSIPTIFVLGTDFVTYNQLQEPSGIYVQRAPGSLTITWLQMPEDSDPERHYTAQLTLDASGVFLITFVDLPATSVFDVYARWKTLRLIGALPGSTTWPPQQVQFQTDLPLRSGAGGVVQDFHLTFRKRLHAFLIPLFLLILFSALLVTVGLPLLFYNYMTRPLQMLLAGMKQVDAGQLDVAIPVENTDEFGTLTVSFNRMVTELRTLVTNLEGRVAERTAELSRSQQQTEVMRQQLDAVLNSLDALIYVSDMQTHKILFANKRLQEVFGPIEDRLCWQALQDGQNGPCAFCTNSQLLTADGRPAAPQQWEQQNTHSGRWYATSDSAITWIDGHLVRLSMSTDITRLKEAESQLLAQQQAITILEERALIGQELHDRLGQVFGFLSVQSQAAQALFAANKVEVGERLLTRLAAVAQDSHSQVREFILGMKGTATAPLNFWEELPAYTTKLQRLYDMEVILELPTNRYSFLPSQEMHLLRIIQEALTNIRQHSNVNQARVSFDQGEEEMRLIITDQGRGFDPQPHLSPYNLLSDDLNLSELNQPQVSSAGANEHFGLSGMRERARALGGTLTIHSRPGVGAQIILTFPIGTKDENASRTAEAKDLRVLLVDDQPIFLEGLSNLLQAYGLHVVGTARDGIQAQEMARITRPDVIIMDIHMPTCDGITATRRIKAESPDVKIVVLSVSAEDDTLFEALKAGATGYLLKSMDARDFFSVITGLEDGTPPIAPQLAGKVLREFQNILQTEASLTAEQTQILKLLAQGYSYLQIAFELHVSERTVKRYMKEIMHLLHLRSRAEAETYARKRGL